MDQSLLPAPPLVQQQPPSHNALPNHPLTATPHTSPPGPIPVPGTHAPGFTIRTVCSSCAVSATLPTVWRRKFTIRSRTPEVDDIEEESPHPAVPPPDPALPLSILPPAFDAETSDDSSDDNSTTSLVAPALGQLVASRIEQSLHANSTTNPSTMSAFTALNVEPEENPEEDVDNTREIQIEEAIKLYQTALKLHSQGPKFYEQAAEAYDALFNSEVFKYPESLSEFDRLELHPEAEFEPDLAFGLELDIAAAAGPDGSNSLPQILFLSFKNHGQFIIDVLKHKIKTAGDITHTELRPLALQALDRFTQALARDESDTELWRRAARLGSMLGSKRLTRYCLEAALEVDDDPTQREVEPSALEEGFAGVLLKEHLEVLSDEVALSHPIMGPYSKKTMSERLKKYMDPYPFLPALAGLSLTKGSEEMDRPVSNEKLSVVIEERSWSSLADALLLTCINLQGSCVGINLIVPDGPDDGEEMTGVETVPETVEQTPDLPDSAKEATPSGNESASVTTQEKVDIAAETAAEPSPSEQDASQTSRKRSQSAAGLRDTPDDENGTAKRSKRIRNRETIGAEGLPADPAVQLQERLAEFNGSDPDMFNYINTLLEKLSIPTLGSAEALQSIVESDRPLQGEEKLNNTIVRDLRDILQHWNETKAAAFVAGSSADILGSSSGGSTIGLSAFFEHSKTSTSNSSLKPPLPPALGLSKFIKMVNDGWMPLQDIIFEFLHVLQGTYANYRWSESMKYNVVQLMTSNDASIYARVLELMEHFRTIPDHRAEMDAIERLGQMVFELHLDIYTRITNPNSKVDLTIRTMEKERLARWVIVATDLMQSRPPGLDNDFLVRHLWSITMYASLADNVEREHIISSWTDLKEYLKENGDFVVDLQNNAAMPEVSVVAADREISKLTTQDFFINLFSSDRADPLMVIETLEPVLDPRSIETSDPPAQAEEVSNANPEAEPADDGFSSTPALRRLWRFLQGGNSSLRIFLWQRLREAYQNIDYTPKIFSCYLKSIEVIVADMMTEKFVEATPEARQHIFLQWLKTLDDLLVKALTLALNNQQAFEVIDDIHVRSTASALVALCRCLHAAALFDDQVKIGAISLSSNPLYHANGPFGTLLIRLREMQVRCWALLYTMLKDGMSQFREIFPTMDNDLADYLAVVHLQLGKRKMCKVSNKIFLKMMKVEMIRFKHVERWDDYLGQVLYDLYGLKLGHGVYVLEEHGCPVENLDRRTAFSIADKVIGLANGMQMKDLLKNDLRTTIEKMQQVLGQTKTQASMQHNNRNLNEFVKSSINPLRLYDAMRGQLTIDFVPVVSIDSPLADKGWYFLHGMMALTKFKSQKRLAPGATDDLRVAMSFFRLQLQFSAEHWESWYRLAQCYDLDLEENVLFSADKLNNLNERKVLIGYQKAAIHCYAMAMSVAMRNADMSFETASKMSELAFDFGMRIYSSTREPFKMQVFHIDEYERWFSGAMGMYKGYQHGEMQLSMAWKFAAQLFIRAAVEKPDNWQNHYMLGKCYWKSYTKSNRADPASKTTAPTLKAVLKAFERAIEVCPKPTRSEPVLEPHYKYMAIMHKLVLANEFDPQEAANKLQQQPYAINKGAAVEIKSFEDWRKLILESIRNVQHADKSNWHHRMIFRVARILYDPYNPTLDTAAEARHELKLAMFTKTMVFNVWKPEYERPGRHCVYTGIYIRFMIGVLAVLQDRSNTEQLAKRVRRKPADIYKFNDVWSFCMEAYLDLIRRDSKVIGRQEELMRLPSEEFNGIADVLKIYVDDNQDNLPDTYTYMKEIEDLKKINAGLIKSPAIDDLIQDLYSQLFMRIGVTLPRAKQEPEPVPESAPSAYAKGPMSINAMLGVDEAPPAQPAPVAELPKPRQKAVTRKEILRRAEALLTKADPPKPISIAPQRPKLGEHTKRSSANGSIANSASGSGRDGDGKDQDQDQDAEEKGGDVDSDDGDNENEVENGGDAAEDADDESDLSDVPDVEELEMSFPNLGNEAGNENGTSASVAWSTQTGNGGSGVAK